VAAVELIKQWTGGQADALRRAMRMSIEAFARHLGASARTVSYWRERPDTIPQPSMQAALDTVLSRAPEHARAQFWVLQAEQTHGPLRPAVPSGLDVVLDAAGPEYARLVTGDDRPAGYTGRTRLITPGDLARIRSIRARLKGIDNAHGGGAVLPMATAYLRNEVLPLLRDHGKRVARVRVDRRQRGLPGGQMIGVAAPEPLPVPLRAPGHHPLRADLPDHPHQVLMEPVPLVRELLLGDAKEPHLAHAQQRSGLLLLGPADPGNLGPGNLRVETTARTVGHDAVRHLDPGIGPPRDRPAEPELRIVRMGDNRQHPLDFLVRQDRHSLPPAAAPVPGHCIGQ
jgi:hypothetical protein